MTTTTTKTTSRTNRTIPASATTPHVRVVYIVVLAVLLVGIVSPVVAVLIRGLAPGSAGGGTSLFDASMLRVIANTLVFACGATLLGGVLGFGLAFVVTRLDVPGVRGVARVLPIVSLLMPPLVGALGWQFLGAPNAGLLNALFRLIPGVPNDYVLVNIHSFLGVLWVGGVYLVPYTYLYALPALQQVAGDLEEAGRMAGAPIWYVLRRITLPVIRPTLLSALLISLMIGFAELPIPLIIGTPINFDVLSTTIWELIRVTNPPAYGQAAVLGVVLLLPTFLGLYVYRKSSSGVGRFEVIGGRGGTVRRLRLSGWRWVLTGAVWAYILVAVVLPTLAVIYVATTPFWSGNLSRIRLTSSNFTWVLNSSIGMSAIRNSFFLAIVSATICMLIALIVGFISIRTRLKGRGALEYVAMMPLAVPNMVIGLGLFLLYLRLGPRVGLYQSNVGLVVGYSLVFLPLALRAISGGLYQVSAELEEAARMSGASMVRVIRKVTLPLLVGFVLSAWILLFVLAFRELPISVMVAPTGRETVVAAFMVEAWLDSVYPHVAAYALFMFVVNLVVVVGLSLLQRRLATWIAAAA